ncbi:MAG: arginine-tRNA-protein transferase [Ignavibacteriaceae bacterium]|nr:hypothetical protein [Ignavibacteriaceae bacterium]NUM69658.1 arginine-tRNA-protein transferase [Ignavibacteriaceae bacterium]
MSGLINEQFDCYFVTKGVLDILLAGGWRHFGTYFFRYDSHLKDEEIVNVLPLRVNLAKSMFSKSQKNLFKKNEGLEVVIRPTRIDDEKEELFYNHVTKFEENIPSSLYEFLSDDPDRIPCENVEICLYHEDRLIAASFLDIGDNSTSAVYAMYDLNESKRGLGIFTTLLEIQYSIQLGKKYYYLGYAYETPSFYDYKKNYHGLEYYDWRGAWDPYPKGGVYFGV